MLQQIEIEVTEDEKLTLSYRDFQYRGLQVNLDQYIKGEFEYDEIHYKRVIETLLEKYTLLQQCLFDILNAHKYKNISVQNFDFFLNEYTLIIRTGR